MIDKVQKIREKVEGLKSNLIHGACSSQVAMETRCKEEAYNEVLAILDSLQEEPDYCCGECAKWVNGKGCSREKQNTHCITDAACEEGVKRGSKQKKPKFKVLDYIKPIDSSLGSPRTIVDVCDSWYVTDQGTLDFEYEDNWKAVKESVSEELEKIVEEIAEPTILNAYGTKELARRLRNTIYGTSISDDLGEYINELSKQFPEVSFAKLSRIAVRVAKWQKQQDQSTIELAEDHAMLAGMEKMKEQMMAKAIDGDITFDYYGDDDKTYGCIAHDSFCLEDFGLKDMDKVKIILIKED